MASDDEDSAAAMAAMMGFSTFGTQGNPTKKRKFNAATDAFVGGPELEALDRGGKKGQGSGGNTIPLGRPRVLGTPAVKTENNEEIDLEDEGEEPGQNYMDTSLPPPVEMEGGVSLVDDKERRDTEERIDAVLANIQPALAAPVISQQQQNPLNGPGSAFSDTASIASSSRGHAHGRGGQRNELWYVGYYDPSFNENPWARLEKQLGLESKGSWLEREKR